MKKLNFAISITLFCVGIFTLNAQEESLGEGHQSIRQQMSEYYQPYWDANPEPFAESEVLPTVDSPKSTCELEKVVYGWHPYWINAQQYQNYDWSLLSHMAYFSYAVNPNTGYANNIYNFNTDPAVTAALNNGVKVTLCATLFDNHSTFLNNPTARQNFITNIITIVQNRGAHGVNIDFEGMTSTHNTAFASFMNDLADQMHAAIPGSDVSTVLNAVEWSDIFNINAMKNKVDKFIIMGYDYYWGGSAQTGPTDPLYSFLGLDTDRNIARSVTYYLAKGCPKEKLILGLPYYGRWWGTQNSNIPSSTTGTNGSTYYKDISSFGGTHSFDNDAFSDIYVKNESGTWKQLYVSGENAMRKRLEHIRQTGIGGMGIWALGFDDGKTELWNAIEDYMTTCNVSPCEGSFHDFGGPTRKYYQGEDYTWTIAPEGASSVTVQFSQFDVASSDKLYVYDGNSTGSPQVPGSPFSGTTIPSDITSTTGAITFRFTSTSNSTRGQGFKATYYCSTDNIPPTTNIELPSAWVTEDFEAAYIDTDNTGGSGVAKGLYTVQYLEDDIWKANATRGFFVDEFEGTALSSNWTSHVGNWSNSNQTLIQSDDSNGNTNISFNLTQNLSNIYLYEWDAKISGSSLNRRAGIHFFCSDPTADNRGDSYLVYFRAEGNTDVNNNNKVQIYKSESNNLGSLKVNASHTVKANQWQNFKVIFDRISGKMWVYIDNELAATWTDPNPYNNGLSVSFRTGNCIYEIDNFNVYRSRANSSIVLVGEDAGNDLKTQNPSPENPAGRIKSVSYDYANNISSTAIEFINVDWTKPVITYINDGIGEDLDTVYTATLEANWGIPTDPHSGIVDYQIAIGTQPQWADVMDWTVIPEGTTTYSFVLDNPIHEQVYYYTVWVENGAGLELWKDSNGQMYIEEENGGNTNISTFDFKNLSVSPNPFNHEITIDLGENIAANISLYDMNGKEIFTKAILKQTNIDLSLYNLASGVYNLRINTKEGEKTIKLVKE